MPAHGKAREYTGGQRLAPWELGEDTPPLEVTRRQLEVVALASLGMQDKEIAAELGLSPETVKTHLRNARWRVDAKNTAHLVAICLRRGWIA